MGRLRQFMPAFPVVFSMAAWVVSIWGNFMCDSVKYTPQPKPDLTKLPAGITLPDPLPDISLGLWGHKGLAFYQNIYGDVYVAKTCIGFSDEVGLDATWKTAQAFAVLAFVFGFVAMILNCVAPVSDLSGKNLKVLAAFYMLVTLFQGLVLLQLSSDLCDNSFGGVLYEDECDLSSGIKCTIAATVFYFCAGVACCLSPPKEDADDEAAVVESENVSNERKADEPEAVQPEEESHTKAEDEA
jgi:hypothetical protein